MHVTLSILDSLRSVCLLVLFASCISASIFMGLVFSVLLTKQLHFYHRQDDAGLSAESCQITMMRSTQQSLPGEAAITAEVTREVT